MAAKLVKTSTPGIYRRHASTCDHWVVRNAATARTT